MPIKLAVWSGPRNLSTALMYSFAGREDFTAVDEPFYAAYLEKTGLNHPMREEVLASQPHDPEDVITSLTQNRPKHHYQKHMCQHMLPEIPRHWIQHVTNVFLIRHPARVIASFGAKWQGFGLEDIGFTQQLSLFESLKAAGQSPLVIESADIRAAPEPMLRTLCDALGISFSEKMLHWPPGPHESDSVWAPHWYGAVHRSTGFAGPEGQLPKLETENDTALLKAALPIYETLVQHKLTT